MQISSLTEIKLLKRNLKKELRYSEESMQNEVAAIATSYKEWITYNIIEKGITISVSLLLNKLFPKKSR